MIVLLVLPFALLVAACGSSKAFPPTAHSPASGKLGPPAAWIETKAGSSWLAFSSWCWRKGNTGMCVDAIAPSCGARGVPDVTVHTGETVRAHLGFRPTEASVGEAAEPAKLRGRTVSWRFAQAGTFILFTRGKKGDASYVGCAVIR